MKYELPAYRGVITPLHILQYVPRVNYPPITPDTTVVFKDCSR